MTPCIPIAIISLLVATSPAIQKSATPTIEMVSPDGRIRASLKLPAAGSSRSPTWQASFKGKPLLTGCRLGLKTVAGGDLLAGAAVVGRTVHSSDRSVKIPFGKADRARDRYVEYHWQLKAADGRRMDIAFRLYDDAIAFRYLLPERPGEKTVTIMDEGTSFSLAGNPTAYVQYLENYRTSHEHQVSVSPLAEVKRDTLIDMPATFTYRDGVSVAITEAALRRYAGMSLMKPAAAADSSELDCRLTPREDGSKAVTSLPMRTPWRVVLIGERLGDLLQSNTIYCLNDPSTIRDTSWIKPGKMTWAWWNGNVVKDGKPDPPIFSLEAQKRYIDFCAENGIRYHSTIADNSDTPWYKQSVKGVVPGPDTDVTQVRADLDLEAVRKYAASKGVKLWTWVHQAALRGRVEEAFAAFERFGWSGMMVDFLDHDDQDTVEFAEEILRAAARHHILIHFHGIWKPTGLERTYPNLMNHEGALNEEYLKWSDLCTPEHTLKLVFSRLIAGPMDYHLGGFRAVPRDKFKPAYVAPNVLGTRCFQLAAYVCFDNPNPMVSDYPEAYVGQPGFDLLKLVPTWWDETRVLLAEPGRLIVTARRKGRTWYLGGMAAGAGRTVEIPLGFLGNGSYSARVWKDAPDAGADPNRLSSETESISGRHPMSVQLATDGGFVAVIQPVK